jgi:hypothetical protein
LQDRKERLEPARQTRLSGYARQHHGDLLLALAVDLPNDIQWKLSLKIIGSGSEKFRNAENAAGGRLSALDAVAVA